MQKELEANTSTIFLLGRGDTTTILAALRPFQGHLYHTNVDSEVEERLRDALK